VEGFFVFLWIASAICGAHAAADRNAGQGGFFLGLIFGPVGVIAALGLDNRPNCPNCRGRLDGRGRMCQHCGTLLEWTPHGRPYDPIEEAKRADSRKLEESLEASKPGRFPSMAAR
jgi:hypothetical protein